MRKSDVQISYENGQKVAYLREGTSDVSPEGFLAMVQEMGAVPRDYNGVVERQLREETRTLKESGARDSETWDRYFNSALEIYVHNTTEQDMKMYWEKDPRGAMAMQPDVDRSQSLLSDAGLIKAGANSRGYQAREREQEILRRMGR